MTHIADAQAHFEIGQLVTEFQRRLDQDERDGLDEFLAEDVVMATPSGDLSGRGAVADFLKRRPSGAAPISRHSWANLRVVALQDGRFQADMQVTAFHGEAPARLTRVSVLDITEIVVRDSDGRWRFSERRFKPVFRQDF